MFCHSCVKLHFIPDSRKQAFSLLVKCVRYLSNGVGMAPYIVSNISSRTTPRLTFIQSKRKCHTDSVVYTSHNLHIGVSLVHLAVLQARTCSPDINPTTKRTMYPNYGSTLLTFHQHHISIFVIQYLKINVFYTCLFLQSTHFFDTQFFTLFTPLIVADRARIIHHFFYNIIYFIHFACFT